MTSNACENLLKDLEGYRRTCVLGALAELDVATAFLKNGNNLSAQEAADVCACDVRGMECLLDALAGLGYFVKHEGRYAVADRHASLLDSRSRETYIPMMRHVACIQRSWTRLAWAVRQGRPQDGGASILGREEDEVSFIMAMNSAAVQLVDGVMRDLFKSGIFPLPEGATILDMGGGSGTYSEAFLQAMPTVQVTLFDLPVAVELAGRRFAQSPFRDRVQVVQGDFDRDEFPKGFDMVWLSAIIHQMGRQESRMLYEKSLRALKPGGLIVVRDFVMHENRTDPLDGTMFGINMLVRCNTGRVYSYDEIREDLEQAGFADVFRAADVPTMCSMVAARKPGSPKVTRTLVY